MRAMDAVLIYILTGTLLSSSLFFKKRGKLHFVLVIILAVQGPLIVLSSGSCLFSFFNIFIVVPVVIFDVVHQRKNR